KDSPLLLQQIDALQLSLKHLKNENNLLKGAQLKMELASLAPLQVPRVARERPAEALPTQSLYRKTTQLLETLYQLSANAKVVDMRQSKSSRSYKNVPWDLGGSLAPLWGGLGVTLLCPQDDTLREMVQQQPGAGVSTTFGTFPSSSFLKAKQEQAQGAALCGRVTIPCAPGHGQAHRLLLTPDLLQHLRQHFVA
ncbi:DCTN1 protein, partial [Prunella fulvescens]|nr:DCTN1 protein [Prunella fulvescens]